MVVLEIVVLRVRIEWDIFLVFSLPFWLGKFFLSVLFCVNNRSSWLLKRMMHSSCSSKCSYS